MCWSYSTPAGTERQARGSPRPAARQPGLVGPTSPAGNAWPTPGHSEEDPGQDPASGPGSVTDDQALPRHSAENGPRIARAAAADRRTDPSPPSRHFGAERAVVP